MDRGIRSDQHVGLATACAVVYTEITGFTPDPHDPAGMQAIFNDIAHAISNVVPIYATEDTSMTPMVLDQYQLIEGRFLRGAHAFKARDGTEKANLTVERRDMYNAISILRSAHITFRKPAIG